MKRLLWHWIVSALALWLAAAALSPWVKIDPAYHVLWLAPLIGLINAVVGGLAGMIAWFAMPVNVLTLGCFGFVLSFMLNGLVILVLSETLDVFEVGSIWWALALAAVMALFGMLLNMVLPRKQRR